MSTFRKLCLDMYDFTYVFLSAVSSPTSELIFASNEAEREIRMLPLPFFLFYLTLMISQAAVPPSQAPALLYSASISLVK